MEFIADLHIHSHLSRATAKSLDLEHLNLWAQLKGITVVGTGDFTHPQWFSELSQKLEPAEDGLFELKSEHAAQTADMVPTSCRSPVRFVLSGEISSIYKKSGKTRKVHNIVFVPELKFAEELNQRLSRIGNIASDGRPILGLDSRSLLEIVLETSEDAFLIPAHIWTPWFSVLGSKSGFDSIEECFEDLTPHIFAVETGLSSDPAMNWRVSFLDGLTLVSNSDAHSPSNLGREANLFNTELSYSAMRDALKSGDPKGFLGTLEYFAEEGKYHFDGHRKCGVRLSPHDTMKNEGLCPVCDKPVTIGVLYRVEELADRKVGERPKMSHPYTSLLPLTDILSGVFQVGEKSKTVAKAYQALVDRVGPEFEILRRTPIKVLERHGPPLFGEAIKRMRSGRVHIAPGYDGEFGIISLFDEEERGQLLGQKRLFRVSSKRKKKGGTGIGQTALPFKRRPGSSGEKGVTEQARRPKNLNKAQLEAVEHTGGPLLIVAGPGTGKTFTMAHRIARMLQRGGARPGQILAVTFTNKAAQEMAGRLSQILGDSKYPERATVRTFHGFCFDIMSVEADVLRIAHPISILNENDRTWFVNTAMRRVWDEPGRRAFGSESMANLISEVKQRLLMPEDDFTGLVPEPILDHFPPIYKAYQDILQENRLFDFDDLIFKTVRLFESDQTVQKKYQDRFPFISVDEYQDINHSQYRLIRLLAPEGHDICVIGDPDQAIYGFRGADVKYFHRFCDDYPGAKTIRLKQNYRSTETVLRASGQLIAVDDKKMGGEGVWSGIQGAKTITVTRLPTERAEAEYIVKAIDQEVGGIAHFSMDSGRIDRISEKKERSFSDFAVLYRIKDQGNAMEEGFSRSGIPFQMVGNERLQDKKGIRELVSYLKVGCALACDLDVERILNFPSRGIGRLSIRAIKEWHVEKGCSLMTSLGRVDEIANLRPGPREKLRTFSKDLKLFERNCQAISVSEQIHYILNTFGIGLAMNDVHAFQDDLAALFDLSASFEDRGADFLAHLALERAQDRYDASTEKVALMTMHAAKGLEFPVVFIAGCEDGLIPYRRKEGEEGDLSEERRLFYVALTRAQEKVYLTHAKKRLRFGRRTTQRISPFLEAVEEDLKEYKKAFLTRPAPQKEDPQLRLFGL